MARLIVHQSQRRCRHTQVVCALHGRRLSTEQDVVVGTAPREMCRVSPSQAARFLADKLHYQMFDFIDAGSAPSLRMRVLSGGGRCTPEPHRAAALSTSSPALVSARANCSIRLICY